MLAPLHALNVSFAGTATHGSDGNSRLHSVNSRMARASAVVARRKEAVSTGMARLLAPVVRSALSSLVPLGGAEEVEAARTTDFDLCVPPATTYA